MKIGELFMALGFDVDDSKLNSFEQSVKGLKAEMGWLALKTTAAMIIIDRFVASSVRGAVAMANFNNQTELSSRKLQHWQGVSQMANMATTAEEVLGSIQAIQNNLVQIRLGGGNVRPFQLLGIDIRGQDAFSILEQVRTKIKGLDRGAAVNIMQEMGISPNMLNVLQLSRKEFNALGSEFVRSKSSTENLLQLGAAINILKMRLSFWKDSFVASIAPAIVGGISLFYRFKQSLENIKEAAERHPTALKWLQVGLVGLAGALTALWVAMNPVKAIFLGLFFIIDDIASYLNGGDSLFGRAIQQAKEWDAALKKVIESLSVIQAIRQLVHGSADDPYSRIRANRISPEQFANATSKTAVVNNYGNNKNITQNNTYNIEGGHSDLEGTFEELASRHKTQLLNSLSDYNIGGR